MLGSLFRRKPAAAPPPRAAIPPGRRVYAIGDIHGRLDLLEELEGRIARDAARAGAQQNVVVYLGDYVDRGMDSRGVLDRLIEQPLPGFTRVYLQGNHEAFLLQYLHDWKLGPHWLPNGGDMALFSYGVRIMPTERREEALKAAHAAFVAALPDAHLEFLRRLELVHEEGDYLFVHAGLRPGVPLEAQKPEDLLWIRAPFLNSETDFGHVVVHGHSISQEVQVRPNRIGIDTGAYLTGRLTALVLEGEERRFLST